MNVRLIVVLCIYSLYLLPISANASLIGISGNVNIVQAPSDTLDLQSNSNAFIFDEQKNFALTENLFINASVSGTYSGGDGSPATNFIPVNTSIDSYYLQSRTYFIGEEPAGVPLREGAINYVGSLTFDTQILGIIFNKDDLINSSSLLGLNGTTYSNRQLEDPSTVDFADFVTISPDLMTLNFDLNSGTPADSVRIITSVSTVPVPPSIWLFCTGLLGLVGYAKRKNKI